jgi:hypothetical protein
MFVGDSKRCRNKLAEGLSVARWVLPADRRAYWAWVECAGLGTTPSS